MNLFSALLWAPVHILPGVVFGASVQLAGAVSFRLVVVIGLLAAILWLSVRVSRFLLSHADGWASEMGRRLANWSRHRKGLVARLALKMLDPAQPAAFGIVAASLFVLLSGWAFFGVLEDVISRDPLVRVDVSVYQFLQSVRTAWGDAVLARLETFGSVVTLTALVMTVLLWMLGERRWHAIGYLLTAIVFSQLLIFALQLAMHRVAPNLLTSNVHTFPNNHIAVLVIVYGFITFLLARRVGILEGVIVTTVNTVIVAIVALAGLYFGRFWVSDAIGSVALASVWVVIIALTVAWRYPEVTPPRAPMSAIVLLVVFVSVGAQLIFGPPASPDNVRRPMPVSVTQSQWMDTLWKTFPCYRSDMEGGRKEPITLQWAANPDQIRARLRAQGWVEGTGLSARSLLSLVSPNVAAVALPVLPKLNNGVPSSLVFTHAGNTRDERSVLRFWPTGYAVSYGKSASPTPIWTGSLTHERLFRPSWPVNILRADSNERAAPAGADEWVDGLGAALVARVNCRNVPVALLAPSRE
jgi:hypothetical protein